jgi:hypothetical protein
VHRLLGFSYPFSNFLTKQIKTIQSKAQQSKAKQNIKHERSLKRPNKMFDNRNNGSFKSDQPISDLRSWGVSIKIAKINKSSNMKKILEFQNHPTLVFMV